MRDDDLYVVISYKWTSGEFLTFWGPNDSGYTEDFNRAGRYTEEQIRKNFKYYNNYYENDLIGRAVKVSEIKERFKMTTKVRQDWVQKKKHMRMNRMGILTIAESRKHL